MTFITPIYRESVNRKTPDEAAAVFATKLSEGLGGIAENLQNMAIEDRRSMWRFRFHPTAEDSKVGTFIVNFIMYHTSSDK